MKMASSKVKNSVTTAAAQAASDMQLRHFSVPEEGAFFTRSALEAAMGWEPGSPAYDALVQRVRAVRPSAPSEKSSSSNVINPLTEPLAGAIEGPNPKKFGAAPSFVLLEPGAVLTILPAAYLTTCSFQVAEKLAAAVGLQHDWFRKTEPASDDNEHEGHNETAGRILSGESSGTTTSNPTAGVVDDAFKKKPGLWKCLQYTAAASSTTEEYQRAEKLVEYDKLLREVANKDCYKKPREALDDIISDLQRVRDCYEEEVDGIWEAARTAPTSGKPASHSSIMHRIVAKWSGSSGERVGACVCYNKPEFVEPKESHLLAPSVEFRLENVGGMVIASGRQLIVELLEDRARVYGDLHEEFYVLHTLHDALSRELDILAQEFAEGLPGKMEAAWGLPAGSVRLNFAKEVDKQRWDKTNDKLHHLMYDQKVLWRTENMTPPRRQLVGARPVGRVSKLPRVDPFSVKPRFRFEQKHTVAIFEVDTISGTFISLEVQGAQSPSQNASLGAFGLLDADVQVIFPGDAAPDPAADAIEIKVRGTTAVYVTNLERECEFRVPDVATRSKAKACVSELRTLVQLVQGTRTPEGQQLLKLHFDEARSWCESLHVPTADRAAYKNRTFEHLSFSVDGLFEEPSPAEDEKEKSVSDRDDSDGEEREEDESANGRCSDGAGGTNQPDETSGTAGSCADVVPMEDDDHPDGISGNADAVPLDDHDFVGESEPEASAEERNPRILCETDTWLDLLRAVDRHRRATNEPLDAPITIRVGFRMPDLQ